MSLSAIPLSSDFSSSVSSPSTAYSNHRVVEVARDEQVGPSHKDSLRVDVTARKGPTRAEKWGRAAAAEPAVAVIPERKKDQTCAWRSTDATGTEERF
jgi:hypothetical protein